MNNFYAALLGIVCLLGHTSISAQLQQDWSVEFQCGEYYSVLNIPEIDLDSEGNIIMCGGGYVIKFDTLGNELWSAELDGKTYYPIPGTGGNELFAIDDDDNIYTACTKVEYQNLDTVLSTVSVDKYSKDGDLMWNSTFRIDTLDSNDRPSAIHLKNGDLYITGTTGMEVEDYTAFIASLSQQDGSEQWKLKTRYFPNSRGEGIRLASSSTNNNLIYVGGESVINSERNYVVFTYDTLGNEVWRQRYFNEERFTFLHDIEVNHLGEVFLTGEFFKTVGISEDGDLLWSDYPTTYLPVNQSGDRAIAMEVTPAGDIIVTGNQAIFLDGIAINGDAYTLKYSNTGELQWEDLYEGNTLGSFEAGRSISINSQTGDYYIGARHSVAGDPVVYHFMVIKYEGDTGALQWGFIDDSNTIETEYPYSIETAGDNVVYVAGMKGEGIVGEFNYVLKKYRELVSTLEEGEIQNTDFEVFPNPTSGAFYIKNQEYQENIKKLQLINLMGQVVYTKEDHAFEEQIEVGEEVQKGVYLLSFTVDEKRIVKKILIN